jgi:hypothetical protein
MSLVDALKDPSRPVFLFGTSLARRASRRARTAKSPSALDQRVHFFSH